MDEVAPKSDVFKANLDRAVRFFADRALRPATA